MDACMLGKGIDRGTEGDGCMDGWTHGRMEAGIERSRGVDGCMEAGIDRSREVDG